MPDPSDIDSVLNGIMKQESGGNAKAVGKAGEIGLHQIKPDVARQYGLDPSALFNPVVNRYVAHRYLTDLLKQFDGDMRKAVEAYNAGPGNVRSGKIPESTTRYADAVLGTDKLTLDLPSRIGVPLRIAFSQWQPSGQVSDKSTLEIPTKIGAPLQVAQTQWQPNAPVPEGEIRNISNPWERRALELSGAANELGRRIGSPSFGQALGNYVYQQMPRSNLGAVATGATLAAPLVGDAALAGGRAATGPTRSILMRTSRVLRGLPLAPLDSTAQALRLMGIGGRELWQKLNQGESVAGAQSVPPGYMVPVGGGAPVPIPKGASVGKPAPSPTSAATPEPLPVRAAGWLPTVGQFIGEPLGAAGGALIPGAGESGVPEYLGAVAGGAGGSATGAELENAIRRHYGLPPVSVGGEAAWGGIGSAIGGVLPFVGRFRKASRIASTTGSSFKDALEQVMRQEAGLEGKVGMGERVARMLKTSSSTPVVRAYEATRAAGMRELGDQYDNILRKFYYRPLVTDMGHQALAGAPGRNLELVGKPFRQAIEEEFEKEPKTVRGAQRLISLVRARMRQLNPDRDKVALSALQDIEKALKADRNRVIGADAAAATDRLDYLYAKQVQRFPLSRVRKAFELPEAAEQILAHRPGDEGRVLEVIDEMRRTGNIEPLRRATVARIWQRAEVNQALTPLERINKIVDSVSKVRPDIFDGLYGKGAQREWLATAKTLGKREAELLKNPNEAQAIQSAVQQYLQSPVGGRLMSRYFEHRVLFDSILLGGGLYEGHIGGAIAALLGVEGYQMVAHSRLAMNLLEKAAREKAPQATARLIISALGAAARTGGETAFNSQGDE